MNYNAEQLSRAVRDWNKERRISRGTGPRTQLGAPMDPDTKAEVLAECAGEAPPVLIPVLKKRRMRGVS